MSNKVNDDFAVGLGREYESFGLETAPQDRVVLDDAVVDDRETAVGGDVRMRVLRARLSVRRPSGVCDAYAGVEELLAGTDGFEIFNLSGFLLDDEF